MTIRAISSALKADVAYVTKKDVPITGETAKVAAKFFKDLAENKVQGDETLSNAEIVQFTKGFAAKIKEGMQWGSLKKIASAIKNYFVSGFSWKEAIDSPHLLFRSLPALQQRLFLEGMLRDFNQEILDNAVFTTQKEVKGLDLIRKEYRMILDSLKEEVFFNNNDPLCDVWKHIDAKVRNPGDDCLHHFCFLQITRNTNFITEIDADIIRHLEVFQTVATLNKGIIEETRTFKTNPEEITIEVFKKLAKYLEAASKLEDLHFINETFTLLFLRKKPEGQERKDIVALFNTAYKDALNRVEA